MSVFKKVFISGLLLAVAGSCTPQENYDILITGGKIIDGSGNSSYYADVALRGDRIVMISETGIDQTRADRVISAEGKVIAPGFIDMHAHLDPILRLPGAKSHITQGVTTSLAGPDGGSPWPIGAAYDTLEQTGIGMNVAYLAGHNTIREAVMGREDRAPTSEELQQMQDMVVEAMKQGAWGLSTGLIYIPGAFSDVDEVIALAQVAGKQGGIYTSHLRDEGLNLLEGVGEALEIGSKADIPAVLTHHKVVGAPMWGKSDVTLAMVDSARKEGVNVMIDQYPYTATHTGISILVPGWAQAGDHDDFIERIENPVLRDSIFNGIVENIINDRGGNDLKRIQFSSVTWDPDLEGKTLYDWADELGLEPSPATGAELIIEVMKQGGANAIFHALHEDDVRNIMQHPMTMIGSDGRLVEPGEGQPHPRWYGAFPRVLGKYVREYDILELEVAIRKMTGLPADFLHLTDRGYIRENYYADIVIFDPQKVNDRATFLDPHQYSEGICYVIVNGRINIDDSSFLDNRAGRALRHGHDGGRVGDSASMLLPE